MQQWCQPSDWQNGLTFFFWCFGTGGSGGGSKPWQRAAIAHSRNLPTNPCLWLTLWRCMSLLDISCQLALGTLDSLYLVHSLCSNCLGWCRKYKPLQVIQGRYTVINPQSLYQQFPKKKKRSAWLHHIVVWHLEVRFKVLWCNAFTIHTEKYKWCNAKHW